MYIKHCTFFSYIRKCVRRHGGPLAGISSGSLKVMDNMIVDLFHQIANEAKIIMQKYGKRTLQAQEVHYASNRIFRGQVVRHAVSNAQKAIEMYTDLIRGKR